MRANGALSTLLLLALAAAAFGLAASTEIVHGAGAPFPQSLYTEWAQRRGAAEMKLICEPTPLRDALLRFEVGAIDFAALDVPLSVAELQAKRLVQFPTAIGGVIPVVNLPGVVPGALGLSGPVLAGMFLGNIRVWNDPAIAALNPSLPLPPTAIHVFHSSEPSGATYLFTSYLAATSPEWKSRAGSGMTVTWPGGDACKDVQELVSRVNKTVGSVGYADYTYAVDQGVAKPKLRNRNGEFVAPTVVSFQAAVAHAPWETTPAFSLLLVDPPWPGSWPLTSPTFAVMPVVPTHPERTLALLRFFYWGFEKGAGATADSGYVSLPPDVVRLVSSAWKRQIKRPDGRPIWEGS